VRSCSSATRQHMPDAIKRIVRAECQASGSPEDPEFETILSFPVTDNDAAASATRPRKENTMPGSDLIFIVVPAVIPLLLAIGFALPFIADSRAGLGHPGRDAVRQRAKARAGSAALHIPAAQADTAPPLQVHDLRHATSRRGSALNRAGRRP
jgi:hypothetical protein